MGLSTQTVSVSFLLKQAVEFVRQQALSRKSHLYNLNLTLGNKPFRQFEIYHCFCFQSYYKVNILFSFLLPISVIELESKKNHLIQQFLSAVMVWYEILCMCICAFGDNSFHQIQSGLRPKKKKKKCQKPLGCEEINIQRGEVTKTKAIGCQTDQVKEVLEINIFSLLI